jgi:hypothetical protein
MLGGHGDGSLNDVTVFWPGVASDPANVSVVTVVEDGRTEKNKNGS